MMMGIAVVLMGALGLGAVGWLRRHGRLGRLPELRELVLGRPVPVAAQAAQASPTSAIPRLIWTYWHSPELPLVVRRCIEGWQTLHPDWQVRVLHAGSLHEWLDDVPADLGRLNVAKQTDWVRLALLHRYGGVWMDASILLTQPLDWVERARAQNVAEFVGFYLDGYTTRPDCPVIESWFLAAPPGSVFVAQWLAHFRRAAIDGETADYLAQLRACGRYEAVTQRIGDPAYHTIHVVAQDLLQAMPSQQWPWRLCLWCAEDSAYWLHLQSGWKRRPLFVRLLWARGDAQHWPALVKLRGGERRKLEWWLQRGWWARGSLVAHSLVPKRRPEPAAPGVDRPPEH